jgi:hypothetical protein
VWQPGACPYLLQAMPRVEAVLLFPMVLVPEVEHATGFAGFAGPLRQEDVA